MVRRGNGLQIGKGIALVANVVAHTTVHHPMEVLVEGEIRWGEQVIAKFVGDGSIEGCEGVRRLSNF